MKQPQFAWWEEALIALGIWLSMLLALRPPWPRHEQGRLARRR